MRKDALKKPKMYSIVDVVRAFLKFNDKTKRPVFELDELKPYLKARKRKGIENG